MDKVRFTYIDLVRGICAIMVLFTHFALFAHIDQSSVGTVDRPPFFRSLYLYGDRAVLMFWSLSGFVFLIAYIGECNISVRRFAAWRFSRLYPLHFATLIIVAILQIISKLVLGSFQVFGNNTFINAVYHILFISGLVDDSQSSFNAVIWSVSIEIFVYALFLTYVINVKPTVLRSLIIAGAAFVGTQITKNLVLSCASYFFVGCAVGEATLALRRRSTGTHLGIALATLILSLSLAILLRYNRHQDLWRLPLEYGGFAGILMLCGVADMRIRPVPQSLRWIGDTTYSIYLLHMPLMIAMLIVAKRMGWTEAFIQGPIVLVAFVSVVLVLSWLVYSRFEKPTQTWLRAKLVPDRREPATSEMMRTI